MKRITTVKFNRQELSNIIDMLEVVLHNTKDRSADFNIFKWHCDNALFQDNEWSALNMLYSLLKNKQYEMNIK